MSKMTIESVLDYDTNSEERTIQWDDGSYIDIRARLDNDAFYCEFEGFDASEQKAVECHMEEGNIEEYVRNCGLLTEFVSHINNRFLGKEF